jgi:hypothetical protein
MGIYVLDFRLLLPGFSGLTLSGVLIDSDFSGVNLDGLESVDSEVGVVVVCSSLGRIPYKCPIRTAFSYSPLIVRYNAIAACASSIYG